MTQEELDALMSGEIEDLDSLSDDSVHEESASVESGVMSDVADIDKYPTTVYPLPATDENKMVHQLDDVTKESEEKATEIFDIIEGISTELMEKEENLKMSGVAKPVSHMAHTSSVTAVFSGIPASGQASAASQPSSAWTTASSFATESRLSVNTGC
jgi:hypothetical protein